MSNRMQEDCSEKKEPGPVITISRLHGCPGNKVAKKLADELTLKMEVKGYKNLKWKIVSKEIISESARALNMEPQKIQYIFDYEQKGIIDDVFSSHLNKYYKSDRKIRNTVAKVIRNIACEGYAVIIGRAGVVIAHDIARSLHINLEAPEEWRILRISEKHSVSMEEAKRMVRETDKKRRQFREYFEGKNTDYLRFDLSFNCMTLSVDEIVSIIIRTAELKKLH